MIQDTDVSISVSVRQIPAVRKYPGPEIPLSGEDLLRAWDPWCRVGLSA
jgi:hypothetical protein